MTIGSPLRRAALALACALAALSSNAVLAQAGPFATATAPVGANPTAIAFNPATRKIYVANHDDGTVTILKASYPSAQVIATVPVGRQPNHIAVNTETDAVYVSNEGDGTMSVIDARTDQVRSSTIVVVGGAMAVDPNTNHMFMLRESPSDEFNIIIGDAFLQAAATRSYAPVTLAMNPVTNRLFIGHEASTDVVAFNMNGDAVYPTRECPDGNGGLIPDSGQSNPDPRPCMDVPGYPVSVAVNPVTNRAYALTSTGQVAVIQGPGMTWNVVTLTGANACTGPRSIAVNPVSSTVYALCSNRVIQLNADAAPIGATDLPAPGAGIAIHIPTNLVFVPTTNGTLVWTAGNFGAGFQSGTTPIPAGARGVVVDTEAQRAYVLSPSGVTTIASTGFPLVATNPLQVSMRPFPGNRAPLSGSFTFDASSAMSPAPLNEVRAVFYRLITGDNNDGAAPYLKATRNADGSWSGAYAGLVNRTNYSVEFFATNGLEMASINTDKASAPLTSGPRSAGFTAGTVSTVPNPNAKLVKAIQRFDLNADGRYDLTWGNTGTKQSAGWLMNGTQITDGRVLPQPNDLPNAVVVDRADFDGDGIHDLMWFDSGNGWFITTMNGLTPTGTSLALSAANGTYVTHGKFSGGAKADLLVYSPSAGGFVVVDRSTNPPTVGAPLVATGLTDGAPVLVADMDGDGIDDVLFMNTDGSKIFCGIVNRACSAGSGDIGATGTVVAAGDFNRDGKVDLVLDNGNGGQTKLRYSDGTRYLFDATLLEGGSGWHVVAAPDLNGDGTPDLLWRHDDGSYAGWLMHGASPFAYKSFLGPGTGWEFKQAADLNGDGKMDLVWRHTDGRYGPWLMNGLDAFAYATFFGPGTGWEITP